MGRRTAGRGAGPGWRGAEEPGALRRGQWSHRLFVARSLARKGRRLEGANGGSGNLDSSEAGKAEAALGSLHPEVARGVSWAKYKDADGCGNLGTVDVRRRRGESCWTSLSRRVVFLAISGFLG